MKVGIMQPYFFPYIGYFQLISAVDLFVIYDNLKYSKKGWINRNRILVNNKDQLITLPIEQDSDYLDIRERRVSSTYSPMDLMRKINGAYKNAPEFKTVFPLLEEIFFYKSENLFEYLRYAMERVCSALGLQTTLVTSSSVDIDHTLKKQQKVISICKTLNASHYLNPIGGVDLYSREAFLAESLHLNFILTEEIRYRQFNDQFIANLSIIDVLMFNQIEIVKTWVRTKYKVL